MPNFKVSTSIIKLWWIMRLRLLLNMYHSKLLDFNPYNDNNCLLDTKKIHSGVYALFGFT